jgi:phosphinothricin acetyltransferase
MSLEITPMTEADWPEVARIYAAGIETGHATFETTAPTWSEWDAGHFRSCRLVARDGSDVVGWAALSPISNREVYGGVAEVSVYVDPIRSGEGIGTQLMEALIVESEAHGIWTLQSSVFRENGATLALHFRHGFREVGYRERIARHHGVWRNTVILERRSQAVGVEAEPAPPGV